MLSEDAIQNLIKPIIDRQEKINEYVIKGWICSALFILYTFIDLDKLV
jgi:hypothetical protein